LFKVPVEHRPKDLRIPFRVDLRDYASWLRGRDPFTADADRPLPDGTSPILEAFLAEQVHRATDHPFDAVDLTEIVSVSQVLVVLDGFDEVADIPLRNRIVEEVSSSAARLSANAISAQVIVTSRPAAFANSLGFDKDQWQHAQLRPLTRTIIEQYAEKWLAGRGTTPRDKRDVTDVLAAKLREPHIRDLARNPMQLAILLNLISVQGASLPDERTELYDKYVNIYFNRESEKSSIVRDNRTLLINVHRYLAWVLTLQAEKNLSSGKISEGPLIQLIKDYVEDQGHDGTFVTALFRGVRERVGALVSRVQGTFEFEVQPLREYFTARYLYETAPHSPAARPQKGTREDRFQAIAEKPYWLNVTRFYAGCYTSGELASLREGLDELQNDERFKSTSYIQRLRVVLLSDYVFNQKPRRADKIAHGLFVERGFRLLLAGNGMSDSDLEIRLPDKSGKQALVDACKAKLFSEREFDLQYGCAIIIQQNLNAEDIVSLWLSEERHTISLTHWLRAGVVLDVFVSLSKNDCRRLLAMHGSILARHLFLAGRLDVLGNEPQAVRQIFESLLDGDASYRTPNLGSTGTAGYMECLATLITIFGVGIQDALEGVDSGSSLRTNLLSLSPRWGRAVVVEQTAEVVTKEIDKLIPPTLTEAVRHLVERSVAEWKQSVAPWCDLIGILEQVFGKRWALVKFAAIGVVSTGYATDGGFDLADSNASYLDRLASAYRNRNVESWWEKQIRFVITRTGPQRQVAVLAAVNWMPTQAIIALSDLLSTLLDGTDNFIVQHYIVPFTNYKSSRKVSESAEADIDVTCLPITMSPRLASLLCGRLRRESLLHVFNKYLFAYRGPDRHVLHACMSACADLVAAGLLELSACLDIISHAHSAGVGYRNVHRSRRKEAKLDANVAKSICEDASRFPASLLAEADRQLIDDASSALPPVGDRAEADGWFLEAD
jgi:hypothetical protein